MVWEFQAVIEGAENFNDFEGSFLFGYKSLASVMEFEVL